MASYTAQLQLLLLTGLPRRDEHAPGQLTIPGLDAARAPGLSADQRLDALAPLLLDEGERSGHRILKKGAEYGTVSSALPTRSSISSRSTFRSSSPKATFFATVMCGQSA